MSQRTSALIPFDPPLLAFLPIDEAERDARLVSVQQRDRGFNKRHRCAQVHDQSIQTYTSDCKVKVAIDSHFKRVITLN